MNPNTEIARINRNLTSFVLNPRCRYGFALPMAATAEWQALGVYVVNGSTILPADERWSTPTRTTGPVDPEVAFAVAVSFGE